MKKDSKLDITLDNSKLILASLLRGNIVQTKQGNNLMFFSTENLEQSDIKTLGTLNCKTTKILSTGL